MRAQEISVIPQLDGPISLPTRDPIRRRVPEDTSYEGWEYSQGGTYLQGASIPQRRQYQEKTVMMIMSIEDHTGIGDPLKEEDIQIKVEGHLIKEDIPIEMEGLPEEEDILEEDS